MRRRRLPRSGRSLDVGGVDDTVLRRPEVDEGRLHAGEDVADLTEVDVADDRREVRRRDVMLDEDRAVKDDDLGLVGSHPDEHLLLARLDRQDDLVLDGPGSAGARTSPGRRFGFGCGGPCRWRPFSLLDGGRGLDDMTDLDGLTPIRSLFVSSTTCPAAPRRITSGERLRKMVICFKLL